MSALSKLIEAERRVVRQKWLELATRKTKLCAFASSNLERKRVEILQKLGLTLGDK